MEKYETQGIDQVQMDRLGPMPHRALEALADLGLSDSEMARYFSVDLGIIRILLSRATGCRSMPITTPGAGDPEGDSGLHWSPRTACGA